MGSGRLRGGPGSIDGQIQSTHGSARSPAGKEACPKHYCFNPRQAEEALFLFYHRTARNHRKENWCRQHSWTQVLGFSCVVDLADGIPEQIASAGKEAAGRLGLDSGPRIFKGYRAVFTRIESPVPLVFKPGRARKRAATSRKRGGIRRPAVLIGRNHLCKLQ